MLRINKFSLILIAATSLFALSCKKDSTPVDTFDTSGSFTQNDQMARPAINTVFVSAPRKNEFNTTVPTAMSAAFKTDFVAKLAAFGYVTNILGLNASAFADVLVNDVLNVKTNGTTTFYDGVPANTLSGRTLNNDVIDVELILIFGGAMGTSNPGLTSDHVNANDKAFLTTFPFEAAPF